MPPESLSQLAARVGRTRMTVWLWVNRGVTVGGRVVRLGGARIGKRWTVTREAWEQFERDCNPQARPLPESPTAAARRAERARKLALELTGGAP